MAKITLHGKEIYTISRLPEVDTQAPNFNLLTTDLNKVTLDDYKGYKVIMNIFPSIDTGVCATSVRKFNEKASDLENTKVLCISRDLPFAQSRFCGAEGLNNVECLSDFKEGTFGRSYGVEITESGFSGLHARAIVVLDETGKVTYTQLVPEIAEEPDYEKALKNL